MRSPSRTWKIFAIVVGIVAAGAPVLAFNWWIKSHGEDEASLTATWALGHAEAQIGQAIAAIKDLAVRGVDSCKPPNIEAMRRAAMQTGPVKEFALIGANSQIVCTDTGGQSRPQVIVTMATADRDFMLDLVRVVDERFLRVRKMGHLDKPAIAALVPASLLLPQVSINGGPFNGSVRLIFANGAQIAETGPPLGGASEQHYARQRSQAYGVSAAVTLPYSSLIATHDSLNRVGVVVTGSVSIVILLFAFILLVRRRPRKPIADLVRAILAEEFVPFYQPMVDIQTGKLVGAEVLVRWRKPNGKILEPAAFAPLVESSGLAVDLTRSLMRRVREEIGPAIGKRPHLSIAFNIAPEHFDDALIVNDVGTIFDSSPVKLTQMVLELTERSRIDDLSGMRNIVAALQEKGCKVAIDDMGNDHCGLSYVLKLGVDIIKIDSSIVQSIDTKGIKRRFKGDHRDADRARQEYGNADRRRGRREFRPGDVSARTRHRRRAGLRVRPAAAVELIPATARRHGSGRRSRSGRPGQGRRRAAKGCAGQNCPRSSRPRQSCPGQRCSSQRCSS